MENEHDTTSDESFFTNNRIPIIAGSVVCVGLVAGGIALGVIYGSGSNDNGQTNSDCQNCDVPYPG